MVFDHHIIPLQRERYKLHNVHEAEEEKLFLKHLENVPKKGVYVNIGAAIGYYSILAKLSRPDLKVHAYEPLKIHRKRMKENISLNKIQLKCITIFKEAVSGIAAYSAYNKLDFSSFINNKAPEGSIFSKLIGLFNNNIVKTIPLNTVIQRAGGTIDLLQMDIQGHELEVFNQHRESFKNHDIKTIIVGTHSEEIHSTCSEILTKAGYTLCYDCFETELQPDGILIGVI